MIGEIRSNPVVRRAVRRVLQANRLRKDSKERGQGKPGKARRSGKGQAKEGVQDVKNQKKGSMDKIK